MFHNFNKDISYILKRVIIGVLIALVLGFISTRKVQAATTLNYTGFNYVYSNSQTPTAFDNSYVFRTGNANLLAINVMYPTFEGYYLGNVTITVNSGFYNPSVDFLYPQVFTAYVLENGVYNQNVRTSVSCTGATCTYDFVGVSKQLNSYGLQVQLLLDSYYGYFNPPSFRISSTIDVDNSSNGIGSGDFNNGVNNIIINNNDNTQTVINNNNDNTQNIINNQNENTESINNTINDNLQTCDNENTVLFSYDSSITNGISYSTYPACTSNDTRLCYTTRESIDSSGAIVSNNQSAQVIVHNIPIKDKSTINVITESLNNSGAAKTYYYRLLDDSRNLVGVGSFTLPARDWNTTNNYEFTIDNSSNASYLDFNFYQNRQSLSSTILYSKVDIYSVGTGCRNKLDDINSNMQDINNTLNDDNVDTNQANDFFSNFNSNNHGLSGIISAPLRLINSLSTSTCSSLVLPLPFVQQNATLPCMSTVYNNFPTFYSLWQLITTGLIGYWVIIKIYGKIHEFQDPNVDRVEVLDL